MYLNPQYILPTWKTPNNIKTIITTRVGGFSKHPYSSFNLATHVNDNPFHVQKNRELLYKTLHKEIIWLNQNHGTNIFTEGENNLENNYDAIILTNNNQIAAIQSADCAAILLTDINGNFVAGIHAGWKGLHANIITKTISKLNTNNKNIICYISPHICKKHFIVSNDVYWAFIKNDSSLKSCFTANQEKFNCSLLNIILKELLQNEILYNNIEASQLCTVCNNNFFYSHRKEKVTGRFVSLIWKN